MKKLLSVSLSLLVLLVCTGCEDIQALGEPKRTYFIDVKVLQLEAVTKLDVYDEKQTQVYTIKGRFWTVLTDPLSIYNMNDEVVGKITDNYNLFRQDDHEVIINDEIVVTMNGKFSAFDNKYILLKGDEEIGKAWFDFGNWTGKITDKNGKVIASYERDVIRNDFRINVYEDDFLPDQAILMVIAAYHSDRKADERNASNNSSSNNSSD